MKRKYIFKSTGNLHINMDIGSGTDGRAVAYRLAEWSKANFTRVNAGSIPSSLSEREIEQSKRTEKSQLTIKNNL